MNITTRDLAQLTQSEARGVERFAGEGSDMVVLEASRNSARAIRRAIDHEEHCCDECDCLDRMYGE